MSGLFDRDPFIAAAENGCVVVLPGPHELFIDVDSEEDHHRVLSRLEKLGQNEVAFQVVRDTPSPSGEPGRRHIVVSIDRELTAEERIAWQAALGSDPVRELLSLVRIAKNIPNPTVFFERPEVPRG